MLASNPPGYQPPVLNRQIIGPLGTPGVQGKALTPGGNFGALPFGSIPGTNFGPSQGTSSFSVPSSSAVGANQSINQQQQSEGSNRGAIVKALMGNQSKQPDISEGQSQSLGING